MPPRARVHIPAGPPCPSVGHSKAGRDLCPSPQHHYPPPTYPIGPSLARQPHTSQLALASQGLPPLSSYNSGY